jgi:hypothetical protein
MEKETPYPIFQIGFNKCGTTSLHNFFKKNNYRSYHWENGKIAKTIEKNLKSKDILEGCNKNSVFCDIEDADNLIFCQFYFKHFFDQHKNSKFILNIRDKDKWIASRLNHGNFNDKRRWKFGEYNLRAYAKDMMIRYGRILNIDFTQDQDSNCSNGPELLIKIWSAQWDSHIKDVKEFFKGGRANNLLIFDIEKDNINKLINFFKDLDLDSDKWNQSNKT